MQSTGENTLYFKQKMFMKEPTIQKNKKTPTLLNWVGPIGFYK